MRSDETPPARGALRRWIGKLPRWPYLLAGAVVVAVGKLLEHADILKSAERFARAALDHVGSFSPFSLAASFLGHFESCQDRFDIQGNYVDTVCRQRNFLHPVEWGGALYRTFRDLLDAPNLAASLILLAALVAGYLVSARIFAWLSGDGGDRLMPVYAAALAAPFAGSCIAFILQWVGIVFFTVFGAVIGFMIWIGAQIVAGLAILRLGRDVQENATLLKRIKEYVRPPRN